MASTVKTDLISLLLEDHRVLTRHMEQVLNAPMERREELFFTLVQRVMAHEAAEELVVYPAVRKLAGGEAVADERIAEQAQGEAQLLGIERLHPTSNDFASEFAHVLTEVKRHAHNEEITAFSMLEHSLSASELEDLGERYEKAKAGAPTHPHPHVPHTAVSNRLLGPLVAKFDRLRDRLRHPERQATRPGVHKT